MKMDDPLDAIAVHAVCGAWGIIACSLFASSNLVTDWYGPSPTNGSQRPYGLFMGGGGNVLAAHIIYILVIAAWTLGIMFPFFYMLRLLGILRVPPEAEVAGLDISYHGGHSYPGHADSHGHAPTVLSQAKPEGEAERLMTAAVELALAEVERRGWTPPPPKSAPLHNETSSNNSNNTSNANTNGENTNGNTGVAPTTGMVKSQSLAEVQAALHKTYGRGPPAPVPETDEEKGKTQ